MTFVSSSQPDAPHSIDNSVGQVSLPGICVMELGQLPDNTIIDQTKLAAILGVTTRTIRRMVTRYELPQPTRLAGHSVWTVKVVNDYINHKLQKGAEQSRKNLMAIANN